MEKMKFSRKWYVNWKEEYYGDKRDHSQGQLATKNEAAPSD